MEHTMNRAEQLQQAIALLQRKELGEAEMIFRELQPHPDTRNDASYALGLIARGRGATDDAYGWLCMVSADSPRYSDARYFLAKTEKERGNLGTATRLCAEALKRDPKHAGALALETELKAQKRPAPPPPSGRSEPSHAAATPRQPATQNTEIVIPRTEAELQEFEERKLAKERAELRIARQIAFEQELSEPHWFIERWKKSPVWLKTMQIVFWLAFISVLSLFVYGFLQAIKKTRPLDEVPRGASQIYKSTKPLDEVPRGAPRSWCEGAWQTYKSNPEFFGEASLQGMREQNCGRWGIPPK